MLLRKFESYSSTSSLIFIGLSPGLQVIFISIYIDLLLLITPSWTFSYFYAIYFHLPPGTDPLVMDGTFDNNTVVLEFAVQLDKTAPIGAKTVSVDVDYGSGVVSFDQAVNVVAYTAINETTVRTMYILDSIYYTEQYVTASESNLLKAMDFKSNSLPELLNANIRLLHRPDAREFDHII